MDDLYEESSGMESEEEEEEEEGDGRIVYMMADTLFVFGFRTDGTWGLIDHVFAEEDGPRVTIETQEAVSFAGEIYLMTKDLGGTPYLHDRIYREW